MSPHRLHKTGLQNVSFQGNCIFVSLLSFSSVSSLSTLGSFFVKYGPCMFVSFSNSWLSVKQKTCLRMAVIVQVVKKVRQLK